MGEEKAPDQSKPKVEIPHMIKDPTVIAGDREVDHFQSTLESEYWDGPVSNRVAVLDFDHQKSPSFFRTQPLCLISSRK